jgi:hypothetical protein
MQKTRFIGMYHSIIENCGTEQFLTGTVSKIKSFFRHQNQAADAAINMNAPQSGGSLEPSSPHSPYILVACEGFICRLCILELERVLSTA